ncbi:unnamed protein product [Leuciscus chuanchicus]
MSVVVTAFLPFSQSESSNSSSTVSETQRHVTVSQKPYIAIKRPDTEVDNAVPDINDVQSWSDGLIESWDDCVFTPVPKETQRSVPSSDRVESDPEELPSNQEAYRRESHPNIDNQHIIGLIQDSVKTALNAFEERLNERLDAFERRLDAYESNALQRLYSGTIQQVARDQSMTVELLKQVVLTLKKKLDDDDGSVLELINIMRSMSDEDPEPNI